MHVSRIAWDPTTFSSCTKKQAQNLWNPDIAGPCFTWFHNFNKSPDFNREVGKSFLDSPPKKNPRQPLEKFTDGMGRIGFVKVSEKSILETQHSLVGGWTNPSEKYATVKMGSSSPRIGVKIKKNELPPPSSGSKTSEPTFVKPGVHRL